MSSEISSLHQSFSLSSLVAELSLEPAGLPNDGDQIAGFIGL